MVHRGLVAVPTDSHSLRDRAGVACQFHKLEVGGSRPSPATKYN